MDIYRSLLLSSKEDKIKEIGNKLTDEELEILLKSAVVPISLSRTLIKSIFYSFSFLEKDNKVIEKMIESISLIFEHKKSLPKKKVSFIRCFLIDFISFNKENDYKKALRFSFGNFSKTYYDKLYNEKEKEDFLFFYKNYIKSFVFKVKTGSFIKFPKLK